MYVSVDLSPEEQEQVEAAAAAEGLAMSQYTRLLLVKATEASVVNGKNGNTLFLTKSVVSNTSPDSRASVEIPQLNEKASRAIRMLDEWIKEGENATPEQSAEAQREVEEFKRNMNANRGEDERVLYPDGL